MSGLFRDEKEVKLNDLMRACYKAAEHYRLAVDVLGQDRAGGFKRMAENRAGLCSKIEAFIRACGYLPETLDPDRQTVENLAERTKAVFFGDDVTTMLNHAESLEENLVSCAGFLLELSWPQERFGQLREFEHEITRGKQIIEFLMSDSE